MIERSNVTAALLAGGRGRRMGGVDKGWLVLDGTPLVQRAITGLIPQVDRLVISANRHIARYRQLGYPVVTDVLPDYPGPLAGALSAMRAVSTEWTLLAPVDVPWLPPDVFERLADAITPRGNEHRPGVGLHAVRHGSEARDAGGGHSIDYDIAVVHDGQRLQPLVALVRTALRDDLEAWLLQGDGKVLRWYERHRWCEVDFSDVAERFVNLNTPEEHERAELHGAPRSAERRPDVH